MNAAEPTPATETLRDSYLGATLDELRLASTSKRVVAVADQRTLFPHHGEIEIAESTLVLGGWKTITPDQVVSVSQEFLPEYGRFQAGGARGGFPSLGIFKRTGAPLVLELHDEEPVVLLIGYEVLSGVSKNSAWLPRLRAFTSA